MIRPLRQERHIVAQSQADRISATVTHNDTSSGDTGAWLKPTFNHNSAATLVIKVEQTQNAVTPRLFRSNTFRATNQETRYGAHARNVTTAVSSGALSLLAPAARNVVGRNQ
jgi:hypothetical protein